MHEDDFLQLPFINHKIDISLAQAWLQVECRGTLPGYSVKGWLINSLYQVRCLAGPRSPAAAAVPFASFLKSK